ncbi:hypothetical protein CLAFUW4_12457 [Fulvia fulva]|uniref:DUF3669 domain-containing protein n=1 Tax=Passalora fulva TaxID=5499 RepID=A0A9Q8PF91_PASFU|nr:uncharacterized protein CLAFUR5_11484 [Fulvia fulva]KAK4617593.1 hypothetical protein CLAFUR4_12462 [Fulvia fulva]KAK4618525.1 hypothetical protein CLAFUR0_12473 [Fulvia fulva]UJO21337.1 hypothetical protein CLAFUR5_11484 [Fulvia fulva]WPV18163.1 hypothetical protein CLAFUW4_12457 [Fulvia fulva]WPV32764.1 hypothetical protein CLAFUW7_12464 [Fulvia fulva]
MDITRFQEMQLPGKEYAEAIGSAMAVLHWEAQIDCNDIEFVLGSSPTTLERARMTSSELKELKPETSTYNAVYGPSIVNFEKRVMSLWAMDFDQCKSISMDAAGLDLAVSALERNNYIPRPGSGRAYQEDLSVAFRETYLKVSKTILPAKYRPLADQFISKMGAACARYYNKYPDQKESGTSRSASASKGFGAPNPAANTSRRGDERSWSQNDESKFSSRGGGGGNASTRSRDDDRGRGGREGDSRGRGSRGEGDQGSGGQGSGNRGSGSRGSGRGMADVDLSRRGIRGGRGRG